MMINMHIIISHLWISFYIVLISAFLQTVDSTSHLQRVNCTAPSIIQFNLTSQVIDLNKQTCAVTVELNRKYFALFCVPDLVPPHIMNASMDGQPITSLTILTCSHIRVLLTRDKVSTLSMMFLEEEGCKRQGEKTCTIMPQSQQEKASGSDDVRTNYLPLVWLSCVYHLLRQN